MDDIDMRLKNFKESLLKLLREDSDVENEILSLVHKKEDLKSENNLNEYTHEEVEVIEMSLDDCIKKDNEIKCLNKKCDDMAAQIHLLKVQCNKEINEYKEKISELNIEKQAIECDRNKYFKALENMDDRYKKIQNENDKIRLEAEKFKNYADDLQRNYGKLDEMYRKYLGLDGDIQIGLQRVLSPDGDMAQTAEIFFGYGIQEDNLEALWSTIAMNYIEYEKRGELQDMVNIFDYFIAIHKQVTFKPVNYWCPVIGEEYDERKHTRTSESNATGKITKVILPGFEIGKHISKKSLVCVR